MLKLPSSKLSEEGTESPSEEEGLDTSNYLCDFIDFKDFMDLWDL